jgi:hypothetical protein
MNPSCESSAKGRSGADLRRQPRHACDRAGKIKVVAGAGAPATADVRVQDMSVIGVGLMSPIRLEPRDEFVLFLEGVKNGLLYSVVRVQPRNDAGFFVGAELMCSVGPDGRNAVEPSAPGAVDELKKIILG